MNRLWIILIGAAVGTIGASAQQEQVLVKGRGFGFYDLSSGTVFRAAEGFGWMLGTSFTPDQQREFLNLCVDVWRRGSQAEAREIRNAAGVFNAYSQRPAERMAITAAKDRYLATIGNRPEPLFIWLMQAASGTAPAVTNSARSSPLTGAWRGTKYSGLTFEFNFRSDGRYEYRVRDRDSELAHEGRLEVRGGRLTLTPTQVISRGSRFLVDALRNEALLENSAATFYYALSGGELRLNGSEPVGGVHDFRVLRSGSASPSAAGNGTPGQGSRISGKGVYEDFQQQLREDSKTDDARNRSVVEESQRQDRLRQQQEQDRQRQERIRQQQEQDRLRDERIRKEKNQQ